MCSFLRTRWRYALWWLGLAPEDECPYHGTPMLVHGFVGSNRQYTCPVEDCKFDAQRRAMAYYEAR